MESLEPIKSLDFEIHFIIITILIILAAESFSS